MAVDHEEQRALPRPSRPSHQKNESSVPVQGRDQLPLVPPPKCGRAHSTCLGVKEPLIAKLFSKCEVRVPGEVRDFLQAYEIRVPSSKLFFQELLSCCPLGYGAVAGVPIVLVDPPTVLAVWQQDIVGDAGKDLLVAREGVGGCQFGGDMCCSCPLGGLLRWCCGGFARLRLECCLLRGLRGPKGRSIGGRGGRSRAGRGVGGSSRRGARSRGGSSRGRRSSGCWCSSFAYRRQCRSRGGQQPPERAAQRVGGLSAH
mmetsp:Transcript_71476/g.149419  ORF Transcript_71476/g.149419 Transcript_71476/m.149419 type:complete len:257 (+) Transcript_71476:892-1662(+)